MPRGIPSPSPLAHPTFVELPPFERRRESYLNDADYRALQAMLLDNPEIGDVISGTGGLRKVRYEDKRGKGKRGVFTAFGKADRNSGCSRYTARARCPIYRPPRERPLKFC